MSEDENQRSQHRRPHSKPAAESYLEFDLARTRGTPQAPTVVAADRIVEQRLAQGRRDRSTGDASDVDASGHVATSLAGVVAQPH